MKKNQNKEAIFFLTPSLTVMTGLLLLPAFYTFYLSFYNSNGFINNKVEFVGLKNFISLINDRQFLDSFTLLLLFIITTTLIELVLGFVVALYLNQVVPFAKNLQSLLILPLFILPLISGLCFRYLFDPENGVIASLFYNLNLEVPDLFSTQWGAFLVIILQDVWRMWPFIFVIIYAGLKTVPQEHIEAVKLDGANLWEQCRYVIIPSLRLTLMVATMLKIIESFKAFTEIFVMTGGGPGDSTTILPIFIVKQITDFREYSYGSAASYILLIISLTIVVTFNKLHVKK